MESRSWAYMEACEMNVINHKDGDLHNHDPKSLEVISFEVLQFCNWLRSEGYTEKWGSVKTVRGLHNAFRAYLGHTKPV